MTEIRPLQSPDSLDQLLATQPVYSFLQSWSWGEFQRQVGRRIWRYGAYDNSQLVGAMLVVEHQLLLGKTYLYCPRGPIGLSREIVQQLMDTVAQLGREQGAMYVKIDPSTYAFPFSPHDFPTGFSPGTTLQPRTTLLIDVEKSPDDLQAAMHPKTRYNIRLAEKKGVQVHWSTSDEDFDHLLRLMHLTASRQDIRLHAEHYYRTMFAALRKSGMAELAIATHHDNVLVANLVIWSGHTATYLHGGSNDQYKDMMAPHLVQWRTIQRAQEKKLKVYDLWGIAPVDQPTHKWAGVGRFKQGFGGRVVEFSMAANSILQPQWYYAYRLAKRMRGGVDE